MIPMKQSHKSLVLILGMHRSGTSLVAKAAQVAGVDLGDHLMAPASDNPKGFFEDTDVFDFNQRLLNEIDIRWDIPTLLLENSWESSQYAKWVEEAAYFLENRTQQQLLFAIKDPRLCLTAPIWLKAAENVGLTTLFVAVIRNPLDVARSLEVRNKFSINKGLSLWLSYNYLLLELLLERDERRLFIEYQNVLSSPRQEIARLHEFIHEYDVLSSGKECHVEKFVTEFLDLSLSHSASDTDDLKKSVADMAEGKFIVHLYQCCSKFASIAWSEDQAREALRSISPPHIESAFYRQQLGYFKAELRLKDEEIARSAVQNAEFLKVIETKEVERKGLQELRRLKELKVAELESSLSEMTCRLEEAQEAITIIRSSVSFRVGWILTRPISLPYHAVVKPFVNYPQNLRLVPYALYYLVRHPIKSMRMLSQENFRKAYIVFFKQPQLARDVVGRIGRMLHGRSPKVSYGPFAGTRDRNETTDDTQNSVSIFIVNYNGIQHLPDLLKSLYAQDHSDLEIIMVDNASRDDSIKYVQENYPAVKIVALSENVGFAEANNVAAEVATGRYYCLVNNDAVADPVWLSSLVKCIRQSPEIGAVGSKILFWKKYVTIEFQVKSNARDADEIVLDVEALDESATVYRKSFFTWGWGEEKQFECFSGRSIERNAELYFPVCEGQTHVKLRMFSKSPHEVVVVTSVAGVRRDLQVSSGVWQEVELDFSEKLLDPGLSWIINNAGSEATENGEVRDRGFAVPDDDSYDEVEEVTALCGAAMLIRPEVLQGAPVFAGQFFAYFEDTELSRRIVEAGYKLLYCPESRLFHKHASTSSENSPLFRYYVTRNRILFLALHYPETLWKNELAHAKSQLNHLKMYYNSASGSKGDLEFSTSIPQIFEDWERLISKIQDGVLLERKNRFPRIAIFNNFWNTLGGGEHHACVVAQALQRIGPVDLLSGEDFSIAALERQFDVDLKYCRKVILSATELHHDSNATGQYDIFVNSTFSSDLISRARYSYYLVSFPFRLHSRSPGSNSFLQTYRFLANSDYTRRWISRWWNVDSDVLHPSMRIPETKFEDIVKTRLILHVGRFFRTGHNKKQLELVRNFKKLHDEKYLSEEWRLIFVGQVSEIDRDYLDKVRHEAQGYPIEVRNNQSLETLHELYRSAAIYWHATGLCEELDERPDLSEHFGITTIEAMSYGCVPIVINAGGQTKTNLVVTQDNVQRCSKTTRKVSNGSQKRHIYGRVNFHGSRPSGGLWMC
jgi:GT2 family glycosyltransferase